MRWTLKWISTNEDFVFKQATTEEKIKVIGLTNTLIQTI